MKLHHNDYEIDDSLARQNFDLVYAWLTTTYWWESGLTREKTERGARHSAVVVGAYHDDRQIAYVRVVSDTIRFAWIADVFVEPAHRNKGLARAMVRFALNHPDLNDVSAWFLGTKDAHGVYAPLGFTPLIEKDGYMVFRRQSPSAAPNPSPGGPGEGEMRQLPARYTDAS
jgi:GNAT superfamily N-acetyltransferase